MSEDRVPLFVRLPQGQAQALDRLVSETGRRKQQLVSELLSDRLTVGHAEVREHPAGAERDVLTLEEAAALLRISPEQVETMARAGDLPGRRLGSEWRFLREALIGWLAQPEGRRSVRARSRAAR